MADGLLTAARRWSTPGGAPLDLPGRPSRSGARSDGLEGYARTFLAAAFRVAGTDGDDPHCGRRAYSTRTGPTAPGNVPDDHLAVAVGGRRSAARPVPGSPPGRWRCGTRSGERVRRRQDRGSPPAGACSVPPDAV
ncbi:hypothetical protein GCM10019016_135000 [Streptomyces prasinosporus]|uniref:DUF2264 domain-containing protein n=1 Tax=Streptomyces prasinosporus TaxID=68256 RepID=A0ABP6UGP6_9ACTN